MTHLDEQIRATLNSWAHPVAIIECPESLTAEQAAEIAARFRTAHQGPQRNELTVITPPTITAPFGMMRDAILAVLELHKSNPGDLGPWCDHCEGDYGGAAPWPCVTARAIAEALGLEVADI